MSHRPTVLMRLPAANGFVQQASIPEAIRSIVVLNNLAATIGLRFGFDAPTAASYDFEVAANGMAVLPVLDARLNVVVTYSGAVPAADVPLAAMVLGSPVAWTPLGASQLVQGLGTAGTPSGGVVTMQGPTNYVAGSDGIPAPVTYAPLSIAELFATDPTNGKLNRVRGRMSDGDGLPYDNGIAVQNTPRLYNGATWDRLRTPVIFETIAAVAVTAGTPVSIWTPVAGKLFRLMGAGVSLSVAGSIIFKDGATAGTAVEIWRSPTLPANTPYNLPENFGNGILSTAANNQLWIDVTATGTAMGGVFGTEE